MRHPRSVPASPSLLVVKASRIGKECALQALGTLFCCVTLPKAFTLSGPLLHHLQCLPPGKAGMEGYGHRGLETLAVGQQRAGTFCRVSFVFTADPGVTTEWASQTPLIIHPVQEDDYRDHTCHSRADQAIVFLYLRGLSAGAETAPSFGG